MNTDIRHGGCIAVMRTMAGNSVDAIVTDPPYELGFMGKAHDSTGVAFDPATWRECLRVLKPGGHLLSFGGTRTSHRMAVAVEDAGFEIRDSIAWLYGSGFPKSRDVGKAIDKAAGAERAVIGRYESPEGTTGHASKDDEYGFGMGDMDKRLITAPATDDARKWQGWGTALKPAFEPIIMARKPFQSTVAANVLTHGTGAINVDACRIEATDKAKFPVGYSKGMGNDTYAQDSYTRAMMREKPDANPNGRWPANVILDESQAAVLDEQSGITKDGVAGGKSHGFRQEYVGGSGSAMNVEPQGFGGIGGASRFFYCAKAPKRERPSYVNQDGKTITHSTVKPLTLMRYLVRLVTPPGGTVLDPFAGSGTTLEAALLEGFDAIGIESEADYIPLIHIRLDRNTQ